jgi:four helix bundle protein
MNIECPTSNVEWGKKDFIHKLRISLKELRETQRWLKLIQRVPLIKKLELLNDILESDFTKYIQVSAPFTTGQK